MVQRMQTAPNNHKVHRMPSRLPPPLGAVVLLAGAAGVAMWLLGTWLLGIGVAGLRAWEAGRPLRPDEALVAVVALAALAGVLWLSCCILLELLARLPGAVGRWAARAAALVTPRQVRRLSAALLGLGMTAGLGSGASAATSPPVGLTAPSPAPGTGSSVPNPADPALPPLPDPGFRSLPDPGWVPSTPTVRTQPDVRVLTPAPRGEPEPDEAHQVVVHRGDSLWSIAARHLGPGASDSEVADAWPDWYAANREVIGEDPDLLLPGQVLHAPEAVGS